MKNVYQIAKEREIINESIRVFFKQKGYVEVETPMVVASPGMEPNLTPFETILKEAGGKMFPSVLITSPELAMKKLLGMGMKRIFTLTKVFRNEEMFGKNHNPEFSLLEWYEQGVNYQQCMNQTQALIEFIHEALVQEQLAVQVFPPDKWNRVRMRDLFLMRAGLDLDDANKQVLIQACHDHKIHTVVDDTESDLFYRLFLTLIEPWLQDRVFVYDYPVYQAALSELTQDGLYGQRFELYMNGLELCNGFTELTDAIEQRKRFEQEADLRARQGKTIHPIDETFLSLLPSVKNPTCGNALGIDRLHMILTGKTNIHDVMLFPASDLFV